MTDARARCRKAALALVAVLAMGAGGLALWLRSGAGDAIPSGGRGGGGGEEGAPEALREGDGAALAANPRLPTAPGVVVKSLRVAAPADPEPTAELPTWNDVRLVLVDAVTGLPLDGSVVTSPPSIAFGRGSQRSGPGAHAQLRIEAAPGFIASEPMQFDFAPELATAGVSVTYPLHRAIDLELTVLDAAGNAVRDAELSVAMVGSSRVRLDEVEFSGPGRYLLRRLPYEPRGPVFGRVSWPGHEDPEPTRRRGEVKLWLFRGDPFTVRMPEAHATRFEATLYIDRDRPRDVFQFPALEAPAPGVPSRLGTVRVRARRRDGSPAVGARVRWAGSRERVCDADGVATLQAIDVGRQSISLADPRLVPTTVTAEVRVDETTEVELVEPEPAMLDVIVVDAEGKGVPVARVEVVTPSGMPALDLVDGVLRIDPYTDERGRRTFTRVEPGVVTVRAWAHGGMDEAQSTLLPGLRSSVTAVLR